ncbi:hypothetical protein ACI77O_13680 [Pseudomonas tritici]|uniref:hypothetical protein n=1 Tax=Pseudomonas tritici TaxID=2745518 RepID=UPI00387ACEB3
MTTENATTPPDDKAEAASPISAPPAPAPAPQPQAPEIPLPSTHEPVSTNADASAPVVNEAPQKQATGLNRKLINFHVVALLAIAIASYFMVGKYESGLVWGAVLACYSLLLTSFGSLTLSPGQQKIIVIIGLGVAAAGAYMFSEGLKASKAAAPSIDKVVFDFRANQYKLEPLNQMPCALTGDDNPLHYTCDVIVTPLAKAPAPEATK